MRDFGVVYVAWDPDGHYYWGYWEQEPDGPSASLEDMPRTESLRDAVEWGRARSNRVLIRPVFDDGRYDWAGLRDPPSDWTEEFPRLPEPG